MTKSILEEMIAKYRKENSVKNKLDSLFLTPALCAAGATK